jgi:hypothetical protein
MKKQQHQTTNSNNDHDFIIQGNKQVDLKKQGNVISCIHLVGRS